MLKAVLAFPVLIIDMGRDRHALGAATYNTLATVQHCHVQAGGERKALTLC